MCLRPAFKALAFSILETAGYFGLLSAAATFSDGLGDSKTRLEITGCLSPLILGTNFLGSCVLCYASGVRQLSFAWSVLFLSPMFPMLWTVDLLLTTSPEDSMGFSGFTNGFMAELMFIINRLVFIAPLAFSSISDGYKKHAVLGEVTYERFAH